MAVGAVAVFYSPCVCVASTDYGVIRRGATYSEVEVHDAVTSICACVGVCGCIIVVDVVGIGLPIPCGPSISIACRHSLCPIASRCDNEVEGVRAAAIVKVIVCVCVVTAGVVGLSIPWKSLLLASQSPY